MLPRKTLLKLAALCLAAALAAGLVSPKLGKRSGHDQGDLVLVSLPFAPGGTTAVTPFHSPTGREAEQSSRRLAGLIKATRKGNTQAANTLAAELIPFYQRLFVKVVPHSHDRDEVVQSAVIHVLDRLDRFDGRHCRAAGWLRTLGLRLALTFRREARRHRCLGLIPEGAAAASPDPGPLEEVLKQDLVEKVRLALARLPDEDRLLVQLRILEDRTLEEVGRALGMGTSTVWAHCRRSLARLAPELARQLDLPTPEPA